MRSTLRRPGERSGLLTTVLLDRHRRADTGVRVMCSFFFTKCASQCTETSNRAQDGVTAGQGCSPLRHDPCLVGHVGLRSCSIV